MSNEAITEADTDNSSVEYAITNAAQEIMGLFTYGEPLTLTLLEIIDYFERTGHIVRYTPMCLKDVDAATAAKLMPGTGLQVLIYHFWPPETPIMTVPPPSTQLEFMLYRADMGIIYHDTIGHECSSQRQSPQIIE